MKALIVTTTLLSLAVPFALSGQITARPKVTVQEPSRFTIGGGLLLTQPKGELADNIDNGFGGSFYGMFKVDRAGIFNVRADVGGSQYGDETLPAGYIYGGRIPVEVETSNTIFWGAIGPQLMVPTGRIRPYANAQIAVMDFSTTSSVHGTGAYSGETYASNENQSDNTHSWLFGGGVYFPFTGNLSMLSIDVGANYFTGGRASYLKEGAIHDNSDGSITITPSHSKTDQISWHLGVSYAIPREVRR